MMWKEVKLGEIAEFKNGINYDQSSFGKGIKVISVADFKDYRVPQYAQLNEINPDGIVNENVLLKEEDILFVRSNGNKALVGRSVFLENLTEEITFSAFCIRCRFVSEGVLPKFFSHVFKSGLIRESLSNSSGGTNINNLNQTLLGNLKVPLPPLPTQHKIASILSAYDDGIENNLKRIRLLEEAAQHLYREWFVKFRFPATADRPGWEEVKVVDGLPEDWERQTLGEFCFVNQVSISGKNVPEVIHYIDISSTNTGYFEKPIEMLFNDAPSRARRIVRHGDTIFSTVRPNRKSFALILDPIENLIASTGFAVLTPKKIEDYPFVYLTVSNQDFVDKVSMVATGAAYPAVNQSDFEKMEIVVPAEKLKLAAFKTFQPFFLQKENLLLQNQRLKEGRDMLLPRLMSGVLEV